MTRRAFPAATIVLLREGVDGFELFLQKRTSTTSFGGLYVFPGGKVSDSDRMLREEELYTGLTLEEADARLGIDSGGIDYWIAAVRECFEESGLLLTYNKNRDLVNFADENVRERFWKYRFEVNSKQLEFYQMCKKEELTLALDLILPIGHWITPHGSPKRYDTRFFIARAPEGQKGYHDNNEAVDSVWLSPHNAVKKYSQGKLPMILPTIDTVESLTPFSTVDETLSHFSGYMPGRARSLF